MHNLSRSQLLLLNNDILSDHIHCLPMFALPLLVQLELLLILLIPTLLLNHSHLRWLCCMCMFLLLFSRCYSSSMASMIYTLRGLLSCLLQSQLLIPTLLLNRNPLHLLCCMYKFLIRCSYLHSMNMVS